MSIKKLLLATNNKGKLAELLVLLDKLPFLLLTPAQAGISLDVPEDGKTYITNARRKALAFSRATGIAALADDSGLEVDFLNGAPGVHSARYAGIGASDEQRIEKLLNNLKNIPLSMRAARFKCVVSIATPNGKTQECAGSCRGVIALSPRGNNGFGYDPIFFFPKLNKTMAELEADVKNKISHRALAIARACSVLEKML